MMGQQPVYKYRRYTIYIVYLVAFHIQFKQKVEEWSLLCRTGIEDSTLLWNHRYLTTGYYWFYKVSLGFLELRLQISIIDS